MSFHFKSTVRGGSALATYIVMHVVNSVFSVYGFDVWLASANDDKHCDETQGRPCPDGSPRSKHDDDLAWDFRTHHLSINIKTAIVSELKKRLAPQYQVILEMVGTENEHLHIEWDPPTS